MINKTQEVRIDKRIEDDSDYGESAKVKSKIVQIKLKKCLNKYLKKSLANGKKSLKMYSYLN